MSSSALSKTSSSQSFSSPAPAERLKTKKQVTLLADAMSMDTETFGIPTNLDLKVNFINVSVYIRIVDMLI